MFVLQKLERLSLFLAIFGIVSCAGPLAADEQRTHRERYQQARQTYLELQSQGHDLSQLEDKVQAFQAAQKRRNWKKADQLLSEIETELAEITTSIKQQSTDRQRASAESAREIFARAPSVQSTAIRDIKEFALGVEYIPKLPVAEIYGALGVSWAKTAVVEWNLLEPRPPKAGERHQYKWQVLDRIMVEWQNAGIKNIQLWLKSTAAWATKEVRTKKRRITHTSNVIATERESLEQLR